MFANHGDALRQHLLISKRRFAMVAVALSLFCAAVTLQAQNNFNSGSTGADGAFSPTVSASVAVPESGVFNYTTVNIPVGVTITYTRSSTNKPLTILASGDVVIAGTINIDGKPGNTNGLGGLGGPGGYNGGSGGYGFDQSFSGVPGDGPSGGGGGLGGATVTGTNIGDGGGGGYGLAGGNGGGGTNGGIGGPRFGAVTILPLIGGSGAGGGAASANTRGGPGGGGGGAILIASSGTITLNGTIFSRGGAGAGCCTFFTAGGGGAGGAVRLISNTFTGTGTVNVSGGSGSGGNFHSGGSGGQGYVRVEAFDKNNFTGSTTPTNIISFSLPHPITPPNAPSLRIASVGGVNAPATPLGSLQGVPDIIVPSSQPNPVTVALEGANLPVGTVVQVTVTPSTGNRTTVQSSGLAGTEAASTANASISLPGGLTVVSGSAVIDLTIASAKPLFMEGERVNRIEVAATFGGPSEVTYVTQSGRRIKRLAN
ncbi:MAG TPA: hypothetical protein VNG71_12530 [Pyrinomonadaceae bacterium]|nr:hypothetical protein [Pyrinomonadaceae bacterium]